MSESLLPESAATIAQNCDLAYGELRNTKGGYLVNTMTNEPKSIYTDDGLTFYTWPFDVDAVRSPLVSDTFNRMYFTDGTAMRVTSRISTSMSGGQPANSYIVGVPKPTVVPKLETRIPDVLDTTKYTLAFKFHFEYGGVKYQEQAITPTVLTGGQFRFTPPTMTRQVAHATQDDFPTEGETGVVYKASDTGKLFTWSGTAYVETTTEATPAQAFAVLRIIGTVVADKSQLFDIYTDNSSTNSTGGLWSVAIAKDTGAATYTATLTTAVKESDKEARAYVYTYVNTYGEEGPPSAPTIVTTSPIVEVNTTCTLDTVTGFAPIKEMRIYRTPTGSTVAEYFYAGAIQVLSQPAGAYDFLDNVKAEMLNEPLSSTNFYAPPNTLVGLMSLPNGILCAWKGNELWFSEQYKPWAWNPQNVKPLPATIVGGIAHGAGAIITTTKNPYSVSGVSSDSMTTSKLNVDQAGLSKWSIAVVDGAVVYASNDGLVTVVGGGASLNQSQMFFTRDVWRARYGAGLTGMRFSVWDGRLVVFHAAGAFVPFMLRTDEADGTMTDLPNLVASCAFISQLSDQFYYAMGSGIYQFNGGSDQQAVWQSRESVTARPTNFGFTQTVTEGSWSIEFYGDGELRHTETVTNGVKNFRLPGGFLASRWKIKITGTGRFRELRAGVTARELSQI